MRKIVAIVRRLTSTVSAGDLAKILDINDAHVYRALHGDVTPTMRKALIGHGFIDAPPKRRRWACDIPRGFTPEQAARFREAMRDAAKAAASAIEAS